MEYYCPQCDETVSEPTCPDCHGPTEPLEGNAPGTPRRAEPREEPTPEPPPSNVFHLPAARTAEVEAEAEPARDRRPEPEPARRAEPEAGERSEEDSAAGPKAGQRALEEYIADGYEVFLIAGIGGVGKTELLRSYGQSGYLSQFQVQDGRVMRTPAGQLKCHPVAVEGRRVIFVDAAGEDFRVLYPGLRRGRDIEPQDVEFLRVVSRSLAGLILLLDLNQLWTPEGAPEQSRQMEILAWVVSLLRWLRLDGEYDSGSAIRFQDHVDRRVRALGRRLRVPVLVLFSKADELVDLAVPGDRGGSYWRRRSGSGERTLHPVGEQPFFLAYHHLRPLYEALLDHADHFRFDFSHSLTIDPDTGGIEDPEPCGVSYSLGWLLDSGWRWPTVPTLWWVRLQRTLDYATGRAGRWRRLPEPRELAP